MSSSYFYPWCFVLEIFRFLGFCEIYIFQNQISKNKNKISQAVEPDLYLSIHIQFPLVFPAYRLFGLFLFDSAIMLFIKYKQYLRTYKMKNYSKTWDSTTAAPWITGRFSGLNNKLSENKRKSKTHVLTS